MKRRRFISQGLALGSIAVLPAGCRSWGGESTGSATDTFPPPTSKLVDVHCHVFNGSDLPTVRFIKVVILKAYPKQAIRVLDIDDPDVLDGLVSIVLWFMDATSAPIASKEIAVLDKKERAVRENSDAIANEEAVIDALAVLVADERIEVSDGLAPAATRKVRRAIFKAADEEGIAVSDVPLEHGEARAVAVKAFKSKFDLGVLLRWFALFTRYRFSLSDQLASDYRRQAYEPLLLCPALVDYDYWLNQYVDQSPMPSQVEVMGRISRRKSGAVVHGYVGFDPLRQAAYALGGAPQFDPLALVSQALTREGFLGVKLYPPMGFRAFGNVTAVCQTYPKDLRVFELLAQSSPENESYAGCKPVPEDGSLTISKRLDEAMVGLFDLCTRESACILAHANNSNGSNKEYGKRADPAFWLSVFKRWPKLSVALAHFGSFSSQSVGAAANAKSPEGTWEWTLGKYLQSNPDSPVFYDISYLTEIAGQSSDELKTYTSTVRRWINEFDPDCRHLLYGSDWLMLGVDPGYETYTQRVYQFFQDMVGLDARRLDRIFRLNAGRFLGLRAGDAARQRLLGFYEAHKIPDTRLPIFEVDS